MNKVEESKIKHSDLKWFYQHLDTNEEVQEVSKYLKDNSLEITLSETYDPQSGWRGKYVYLEGRDLSKNGYCFSGKALLEHVRGFKEYKKVRDSEEYKTYVSLRCKFKKLDDLFN